MKNMTLPSTKQAGVCLHLTSLPGEYGIGEIGSTAFALIDMLSSMKLAVWQFLPTGPTAYGDSPYQPLSTFAGNELLIDVASLIQLNLLKQHEAQALRDLPQDIVDYGRLIPLKNALLAKAADSFELLSNSALNAEFDQYLQDNDEHWLHDYAIYRVLKSRHGEKPWPAWDQPFVHRDRVAIAKLEKVARQRIVDIKILQFLFHHQWHALQSYASEKGVCLFGDMPIYIALDSADAWAHPELLRIDRDGNLDFVAGVPPDYFSDDGQLWGNPLYDWDQHVATGFTWWTERLRHAISLADLVRIDHFRGFEAFWSVPAGSKTAREGRWEAGPGAAVFEALRNTLGDLPIVAEDLGVITPAVESLRDRYQIPGMKVLQFEVTEADFDVADIGENCVCYTGTHDNDTTVGWFHGSPDDTRTHKDIAKTREIVLELTNGRPENIHNDLMKLAFGSKAKVAIAPMQDYLGLGSEARLNTPGTTSNNWRWRLLQGRLTPELCDSIREMVSSSGRGIAD